MIIQQSVPPPVLELITAKMKQDIESGKKKSESAESLAEAQVEEIVE
jgi:hypothetical protein